MPEHKLPSKLLGTAQYKIAEFYFRTNDDQLDHPDLKLAAAIGAHLKSQLQRGEKLDLYFVGNCDRTGKAAYNKRLALRRAKTVRKSVVAAAGGWGNILNSSLFEYNLVAARSLGEEHANQNAVAPHELAADRRVDVWQQTVKVEISIPKDVLQRRKQVLREIARTEELIEQAKQHAVIEGSKKYKSDQYSKNFKRMMEITQGSRSMHPIERRHELRTKLIAIRELEKVVERREFKLNDLKAQLRMIDMEIESYK